MKKVCLLKRKENTEYENSMYEKAIKEFGMDPIFIDESNKELLKECSGIVLTGGNDKVELDDYLIEYSIKNDIPLLGICMGMQAMGMYKNNYKLEKIVNHYSDDKYVHDVYLADSLLKNIVDSNVIKVNSHHHDALTNSSFFQIVGQSEDGVIEALENKNHKFQIGVEWHPERMISYDESSRKLFQYFTSKIRE